MNHRCSVRLLMASLLVGGAMQNHAEQPLPQPARLKSSPVLQQLVPNPDRTLIRSAADQTVAQMYVPEGFKVELVAGEPNLVQPIAFTFDEQGRIWVAEALSYPTKRPSGQGLDRISIFTDRDGDGSFESKKVFVQGLNLVSGLEVGHGGVWVGAAPELLFIPDRDQDDQPDGPPEVLLTGFGYQDTHETLNSFTWGPDGWLYGTQGVFNTGRIGTPDTPEEERVDLRAGVWRFHPIRKTFEVFAHGGSNPWGLDFDENGQLFMTHCRSYWGRGPTTHVIQGGHYWNQVNANYASFIVSDPPAPYPEFRNYLLASARYGHGAGGAGEPGSDAIYGGHSHVGTMFYLGDNWPDEFRGHLFTHNLGGHQINQQINEPMGSGYNTVHAGQDVLFCTDPKYVAVDLKYGPDGAVYFIDWYDQQHCHNPDTEIWDRGNGRIYRMEWQATYRPTSVNLRGTRDVELVNLLDHKNRWYARTARRLLQERAGRGALSSPATTEIRGRLNGRDPGTRLNALWTRHVTDGLSQSELQRALGDEDAMVRGWAVQLATDGGEVSGRVQNLLVEMAVQEGSPVVRRYLASAVPRLPEQTGWGLAENLARHGEDIDDRNIPYLLWQGIAKTWSGSGTAALDENQRLARALQIADTTQFPSLVNWIYWYAGTLEGRNLEQAVASLERLRDEALHRRLSGLWLAMEPRSDLPMPATWKRVAAGLNLNRDVEIQRMAQRIAAVFGDNSTFGMLRETLDRMNAAPDAREHAFAVLSRAGDEASLGVFLNLLDDPEFRLRAIRVLGRFDSEQIPPAMLQRFGAMQPSERAAVIDVLTSRASFAIPLLKAISDEVIAREYLNATPPGQRVRLNDEQLNQLLIKRSYLNASHVRRLTQLNDEEVNQLVAEIWGRVRTAPADKRALIQKLETLYAQVPLWSYDERAGLGHFQKLCAPCHRMGNIGVPLGPDLTGASKHGVRYYLENIIDPDAVVGRDYRLFVINRTGGDVVTGLAVGNTDGAVTLRNSAGQAVIPKSDIASSELLEKSMMPEGLLESLSEREQLELLKFLMAH